MKEILSVDYRNTDICSPDKIEARVTFTDGNILVFAEDQDLAAIQIQVNKQQMIHNSHIVD